MGLNGLVLTYFGLKIGIFGPKEGIFSNIWVILKAYTGNFNKI